MSKSPSALQAMYGQMTPEQRRDLMRRFNLYTASGGHNAEAAITTDEAELLIAIAKGQIKHQGRDAADVMAQETELAAPVTTVAHLVERDTDWLYCGHCDCFARVVYFSCPGDTITFRLSCGHQRRPKWSEHVTVRVAVPKAEKAQ